MPAPAKRRRPSASRILAAAEREFARRGYGETSLRQLMAAAGVSTTAFYARFDSKEAVLSALMDRLLAELQEEIGPVLAGARAPEQAISEALAALLPVLERHRALVALGLTEAASHPSARAALARTYRGLVELLAAQLHGPDADRHALAWAFVGALVIQVERWAVFSEIDRGQLEAALFSVATRLLPAVTARSPR